MAGAGYKLFNTGDVLTAAQVNTYLNEQTVMVFADSAARTSALSGVLAEGMMSYLQDTNAVEVYNGTSWVNVGNDGDITEVQAGVGISIASGTGPIPVITNSSTDLITTAGDLLYGTAADTMARLGIGTVGQVLQVNSGATAPEWATPAAGTPAFVGCQAKSTVSPTISNNTTTALNWDSENFDTDGFHSTVTNTSRMTIPAGKGGKYLVTAKAQWDNNSTGARDFYIYKNGAAEITTRLTASTQSPSSTITSVLDVVATDYLEIYCKQNSGSSRSLDISDIEGEFSIVYLGA
jgi:hypothetical protein